jgi:hypothetical protein
VDYEAAEEAPHAALSFFARKPLFQLIDLLRSPMLVQELLLCAGRYFRNRPVL